MDTHTQLSLLKSSFFFPVCRSQLVFPSPIFRSLSFAACLSQLPIFRSQIFYSLDFRGRSFVPFCPSQSYLPQFCLSWPVFHGLSFVAYLFRGLPVIRVMFCLSWPVLSFTALQLHTFSVFPGTEPSWLLSFHACI